MSSKTIRYFTKGNTAKGYYSLLDTNLKDMERLFILKGGTSSENLTCMQQLEQHLLKAGERAEFIHCLTAPEQPEGIVLPEKRTAIVIESTLGATNPSSIAKDVQFITLEDRASKQETPLQAERYEIAHKNAYACFQQALAVHDEWEHIYISHLNKEKANELADTTIQQLFGEKEAKKKATVKRRFLGAATFKGAVDFVPELTEGLSARYFIKGRPGTGKSTMMKKIAAKAEEKGFDTEIYHCGLDPDSLDMIIVRELGFAIFDSTAPHEYFPEGPNDHLIDVYQEAVVSGTDEKFEVELNEISGRYREWMKKGTAFLEEGKRSREEAEELQGKEINPSVIEQICKEILHRL
ncbi:putative ATPase [Bacillus ectoiniformans]|uniref:hypothetical protein n=1 Tax=Bacillus ectoiniformans TaxID=1494429 RepID=UPI00195CD3D9|nr:hypothetical protein [Bacillus ectoiniformans]MBM7648288.1 putative ATPase [Bacillus ectoiniformans]